MPILRKLVFDLFQWEGKKKSVRIRTKTNAPGRLMSKVLCVMSYV